METAEKTTSKLAEYPSSLANAENVADATKLSRGVGLGNACQHSKDKNISEIFLSLKSHIFVIDRYSTRYM